jgi:hypothetical protein
MLTFLCKYLCLENLLKDALPLYPELRNVIESALAAIVANQQESFENLEKEKENDLALCNASSLREVRSFIERYGSIQLVHDRTKTNRIRLPRKILSHGLLLWNATMLVRQAKDAAESEGDSIEQLAASFVIDRRQALPHQLWTERHDSVLVHAIDKHGWIDYDACSSAICNDPSLRWGSPFETVDTKIEVDVTKQNQQDITRILETAERVGVFFNANREMIDDLKSFNNHLVVRAYGLVNNSDSETPQIWRVKRELLQFPSFVKNSHETVDFPPRKDLAKRAKFLLSRTPSSSSHARQQKEASSTAHGFTVLDQRESANIFLAEILRALLREPTQSKHRKRLCALAAAEARRLADPLFVPVQDEASRKMLAEMRYIVDHIDLVKWNLAGGTTQYKNVLRVMLGEEPQKPRKSNEALFPSKRTFPSALQTTTNITGATATDDSCKRSSPAQQPFTSRPRGKTTGEKVIWRARKHSAEQHKNIDSPSEKGMLQLTEIETLILESCCSIGIPVWKTEWRSMIHEKPANGEPEELTWEKLGKYAVSAGQALVGKAQDDVLFSDGDQDSLRIKRSKESSLSQAKEYVCEPEVLAKKTIMLLAAVCKDYTRANSPVSFSCDHGVGSEVSQRFSEEINKWAKSLDLLDHYGRALAFTAIDFLDDIPQSQRCKVDISALLNRQDALTIMAQIAMLWKLRCVRLMYSSSNLAEFVAKAVKLLDINRAWEEKPVDWSAAHDVELINRIVNCGLTEQIQESLHVMGETEVRTGGCFETRSSIQY